VINFVYEKDHQTREYSADQLPADLDSTYTFIKRYDKLVRKGNAEAEIKDFSLISLSGSDSTRQILDIPGFQLMLISRGFPQTNPGGINHFFCCILWRSQKHTCHPGYV
jgi:hypothetical protein